MANCTKCPNQKEIDRLRAACLKCTIGGPGCGLSHGGVSFVSLDAAPTPESVLAGRVAVDYVLDQLPPPELKTDLPEKERANLLRVLEMFARLTRVEAVVVCQMLAGRTLTEIAEATGESVQNLHAAWTRLITKNPAWRALANGTIGSGRGRKRKQKKEGLKPEGSPACARAREGRDGAADARPV